MITIELDGKVYEETPLDDFNFLQFEKASELLLGYNQKIIEATSVEPANDYDAGLSVQKTMHELKLQRPLLALIFVEKGTEFSDTGYEENKEKFLKLKMKEFGKARETLINFLNGGQKFIMENSLLSSPKVQDQESPQSQVPNDSGSLDSSQA